MCARCVLRWYPPKKGRPYHELDREMLMWTLYCVGPAGRSQITQHLQERGVIFTPDELEVELAAFPLLQRKVIPFAGMGIELFSLPGHGIG